MVGEQAIQGGTAPIQGGNTSRTPRPYTPRAPLVSQVDADDLDGGIVGLLADGVERTLSRFKVGGDE